MTELLKILDINFYTIIQIFKNFRCWTNVLKVFPLHMLVGFSRRNA